MKHLVLLLLCLSFLGCQSNSSKQDWYLKGGDIHLTLDWPKKLIVLEDSHGMIFSGVILSTNNKGEAIQLHIRIDNVGDLYKEKYPQDILNDFVIWLEYISSQELKMIVNQVSAKPYFFLSKPTKNIFVPYQQGRYLSDGEITTFFKEPNSFYNIASKFIINILSHQTPLLIDSEVSNDESKPYRRWLKDKYKVSNSLSLTTMTDYLKDLDPSTAFITKEPADTIDLEYIINESKNTDMPIPLKQPISIKGIVINTGNLDNKAAFRLYRRPKQMTIYFDSQYSEGLGSTRANYNESLLTVELADEPKINFIMLYKPILAKGIYVHVDSYYLGEKDEMALFDLVFFGDNL